MSDLSKELDLIQNDLNESSLEDKHNIRLGINKLISALRKALDQRDLSIYNLQAYLGTNIQKEISNKFDAEILKILEGE